MRNPQFYVYDKKPVTPNAIVMDDRIFVALEELRENAEEAAEAHVVVPPESKENVWIAIL